MRDAVRLDPQFVLAWDSLASRRSGRSAQVVGDTQPEQAEQLRAEAQQAWRRVAELAPDSRIVPMQAQRRFAACREMGRNPKPLPGRSWSRDLSASNGPSR